MDQRVIGAVIPPSRLPTLCSSRSFFYPKTEGKAKKPEEETPSGIRETEPPPKYVYRAECDEFVPSPIRTLLQVL